METSDPVFKLLTRCFGQSETITVPRALVDLTGDLKTAVLFSQIIYWSRRKRDEDGWFYKTYEDWYEELALTKNEVSRSTKELTDAGAVETKLKQVGGAPKLHYRLSISGFQKWIVRKAEIDSAKTRNPGLSENQKSYKEAEDYTEEYKQKTTEEQPLSPESKNQNPQTCTSVVETEPISIPETLKSSCSGEAVEYQNHHPDVLDLDLDTPVEKFTQNLLRRVGLRWKPEIGASRDLVARLHADEADAGAEAFRRALLGVEADTSIDWKTIERPVPFVLKIWREYDKPTGKPASRGAGERVRESLVSGHPPIQPSAPERESAALPEAVSIWNSIVPESLQVKRWGKYSPATKLRSAEQDPDFAENLQAISETCRELHEHGRIQGISFDWLFKESGGKPPNWYRVKTGDYGWALPPKNGELNTHGYDPGKPPSRAAIDLFLSLPAPKPKNGNGKLGTGADAA